MSSAAETLRSQAPAEEGDGERLLAQASALGIPWERILLEEIRAERTLREYIAQPEGECPLRSAYWILPRSLLQSFRVRDLVGRLSWEASAGGCRKAARQLRTLHGHLTGKPNGHDGAAVMARHLWFGYQRVLSLLRICRAARKTCGDPDVRAGYLAEMTDCGRPDAEWAVRRETAPGSGHVLDDAMRRAREEGFELPAAESEVRAFRTLQRLAKRSPHSNGRS